MLPNHYQPSEFVFNPDFKLFQKKKVALPVCLVANNAFDATVLIKVTNPNSESKIMGKGTKLGKVITNIDDYVISKERTDCEKCEINSIHLTSYKKMEEELKNKNPDLHRMFIQSGKHLNEKEKVQLLQLLYKHQDVFSIDDDDIGTSTLIKHKIIPKNNKVVYRRQYRHSKEQEKQIDEEVNKLLKNGVIKESMSPFNSPVLMVPKKEPGKWRFCLDCRYINDLTEDEYFPIPLIEDVMDNLAGAQIFSTLDMTSGYHQVLLDDETSDMCAFSTRKGHYQYNRLPMGLRNSGMTFQKMVTLMMSGMLYSEVLAYLDNCILYSPSIQHHFRTLEEVLKRFKDGGLKLKPKKCHLLQKEIIYLGFLVNSKGIRPNPEATLRISELPRPTCVTEVQRFLGKINYYRKFIPNLAKIAHPLYALTECKSRGKFIWDDDHQEAFDKLKAIVSSGQVMGHPDFRKEFILDVDASDYALGAELSQVEDNGQERPIFFASRHLVKEERSYSATARETLAAVFGCEHFSHYLQGKKFKLRTDHNPLVWLRSMKNPKRPYSGWIVRLEQYNYTIQYRPGKDHTNADFNSRIKPIEKEQPTEKEQGKRSISSQTELFEQKCTLNQPVRIEQIENSISLEDVYKCTPNTTNGNKQFRDLAPLSEVKQGVNPINTEKLELSELENQPLGLMSELQAKDEDIGPVMSMLQYPDTNLDLTPNGEKLWRIKNKLVLRDGLLIKQYRFRAGLRSIEQVILPKCLKNMVLESLHDSEYTGHFGVKRTIARVKMRYYWPAYQQDIEEWCKTCVICQERKNPPNKNIAPMTSISNGQGPFEQIALDILKLPKTERGNEFLLVLEDYFSKWVEAFPMKRTVAPGVAQCMLNGWVSRFGCPYSILSDQGSEFTSNLFKCLSDTLKARKIRTSTYHPRTDGMVERSNRTIIDILSKYAQGEPDWDLRIPLVLFAIRTSEHATTGFSPFKLVYGQEAKIPWDIVYGPTPNEPLPHDKWVAARKSEMTKIFTMVKEQTKKSQMHQKAYFDKNLKGKFVSFEKGDEVMYCDPARRSKEGKLHRPWSGPYEVIDKVSDALYKICIGKEDVLVNAERLKKYYGRREEKTEDSQNSMDSDSDEDEDSDLQMPQNDRPQRLENPAEPQPGPVEVRQNIREPIMREGGRLWCNVDPRNIIPRTPRGNTN